MSFSQLPLPFLVLTAVFVAPARAQFGVDWIEFEPVPLALPTGATVSGDDYETDLDWADLDLDGDVDLVVVRKQPFTTTGRRTNVLLMNEEGVLVDRSAELASAADVLGDQGFLTPTNDRDVVLADLDGDGFPEVVTSTEQSPGMPKAISHPRIYANLGSDAGGWAGLRFEDARFPQLLHNVSGVPLTPRFAAVDAGDLNLDGSIDLYFGDHDTGTTLFGGLEPAAEDSNDRLLLNDGNGFFTDATLSSFAGPSLVDSGFCNSVRVVDVNGDGANDIIRQTTYTAPIAVMATYGDPLTPGFFSVQDAGQTASPYFVNTGDLNQDGRLDLALTQNDEDSVIVNLGNDTDGTVLWSAPKPVEFVFGGESASQLFGGLTYSSNNLVRDLDGDGWGDLLIADVDAEIPQYEPGFRLHLYHNRGGTPGGTDFSLVEERASALESEWVGAPGLLPEDLRWTHDVAVFDVDGDGLDDLVLSRREGTQVWRQTSGELCQVDLGFGGGSLLLQVCGGDLSSGQGADLSIFGGASSAPLLLALANVSTPTPLPDLGITVAPFPPTSVLTLVTDSAGELQLPLSGGGGPSTLVLQAFQLTAGALPLEASNAVQIEFLP